MFRALFAIASYILLQTQIQGSDFWYNLSEVEVRHADALSDDWQIKHLHELNPQGTLLEIRQTIEVPEDYLPIALYVSAMASSEIFWNGQLIGSNGSPSVHSEKEVSGLMDYVIQVPPPLVNQGPNQLRLMMSSHHNVLEVGVPVHRITIATPELGLHRIGFNYIPALMTAGSFLLATLYFGVLVFRDRRNRLALPIALMALFACLQLISESIRGLWTYPYTFHVWRLILITIFAAGFSISMTTYISLRFLPSWCNRLILLCIVTLVPFVFFIAPGYDSKALLSLFIPTVISVIAMIPSVRKARRSNVIILLFLILFASLLILQGSIFLDRTYYICAALLLACFFFDQARQMSLIKATQIELERQNSQMELELIKGRIAPHFLMNTLNALIEWVESDPKIAVKMIDSLAKEFRTLSDISERHSVSILEEIQLCEYHLQIMSYRMDQKYKLATLGVTPDLKIPPGVIHTQLENAFTHGRYSEGAEFLLSQSVDNDSTTIELTCPKPTRTVSKKNGGGQGRSYIEKRLSMNFGNHASFEQYESETGAWKSTITIRKDQ
jgi:hypothetical protein